MPIRAAFTALALLLAAPAAAQSFAVSGTDGATLTATPTASFEAPWAMATLPDGRMLVTEKPGNLILVSRDGQRLGAISGTPPARDDGQGGMGDVALHPDFASNGLIYLSPVEHDGARSGAVIYRGRLSLTDAGGSIADLTKIWQQTPKTRTTRHYSQRMAFGPDGYLYVTSGDRGEQDPSQAMDTNIGKVLRLNGDGTPAPGNPYADRGGVAEQFWSIGHRNPLGLAFGPDGTLWSNEMGPRGGDELNRIRGGGNYGWPLVSEGRRYSGIPIPDHKTRPNLDAPEVAWVPSVSPAGLVIYDGAMFPDWRGDALMGGLSGQAIVRVDIDGRDVAEAARYTWGERVREVEQASDGALWALEDGYGGRLVRLTPGG